MDETGTHCLVFGIPWALCRNTNIQSIDFSLNYIDNCVRRTHPLFMDSRQRMMLEWSWARNQNKGNGQPGSASFLFSRI